MGDGADAGSVSWCADAAMWAGIALTLFMVCARVFIAEGKLQNPSAMVGTESGTDYCMVTVLLAP